MSKATYHHGNLREACLDIAHDIICRDGLTGVRLAAVARQAGVSAPALYRHFANRDALLDGVQEMVMQKLAENSRLAYQQYEAGSIEAVTAMSLVYVDTFLTKPLRMELMARQSGETNSDMRQKCFEVVRQAARDFLLKHPHVKTSEDEVAQSIWSIPHGVSHLAGVGAMQRFFPDVEPEKLVPAMIEVYLRGLDV